MRGKSMKDATIGPLYEPKLPVSVQDEEEEDCCVQVADDEPNSVYHSTKCFVGKRNHQTEKPIDILLFFLRYWSDPDDVIKVATKRIEEAVEIVDDKLV